MVGGVQPRPPIKGWSNFKRTHVPFPPETMLATAVAIS